MERVLPVVRLLAGRIRVPISVDTMKAGVARAALEAGASIVNDVAANRSDKEMWRVVAESGAGYVCMHMQGTPQTMQDDPRYGDVVEEVGDFFSERGKRLSEFGVKKEQIIFDPGIGFGKSAEHNLQLLGNLRRFTKLERPLLVGVSRKAFIGKVLGTELASRLPGALACAAVAIESGVQIIRAHDVAETVQAVRMTEAILKNRG
jgi:dihydropteroate synthase